MRNIEKAAWTLNQAAFFEHHPKLSFQKLNESPGMMFVVQGFCKFGGLWYHLYEN